MNHALFADFLRFARRQIDSTDIDPVYPVLLHAFKDLDYETKVWRLLLYVTWYHLGTAEEAWTRWPTPAFIKPTNDNTDWLVQATTGIERRGFRGNIAAMHFINDTIAEAWGVHGDRTLFRWLNATVMAYGTHQYPDRAWDGIRIEFQRARGAGPWASYKWADLLKNVLGLPITASDIGVGGNGKAAGPVVGLSLITGLPWQQCATNKAIQREFAYRCKAAYSEVGEADFAGLEQMETALCDFNSLTKGSYYVGHDIDAMMTQLAPGSPLWASRKAMIPAAYLGEVGGWHGVQKHRKRLYVTQGVI